MAKYERYDVREARPGTGRGLFACGAFEPGEFIVEYTGVKIPTREAEMHRGRYLFEIDDQWTIDGEPSNSPARYINHCCDPNAEARVEEGRINIYAIRPIWDREEITIDYGQEYYDDFIKPVGCKCAASEHRG